MRYDKAPAWESQGFVLCFTNRYEKEAAPILTQPRVPDIGDYSDDNTLVDFGKDLDVQLFKLVRLNKGEQEFVKKAIDDIDTSRNKRKK